MQVDLRSDTVTKPDAEMRACMANAEVGDDVYGEDPTINALQSYAAQLLGKDAALFVPSGTMANLLAFLSQTRPGETLLMHQDAHPYLYEGANIAWVGGLMPGLLQGDCGIIHVDEIKKNLILTNDPHRSNTTLVALENTSNRGGGAFYTTNEFQQIRDFAKSVNMKIHCDGARLFNAVVATGALPKDYADCCNTISICLSKGLGAPVGSLLCGDEETIHQALRYRKMLGGGMRQAGILAAAGLYALQHNINDLQHDHHRAQTFRHALETSGVTFSMPSPTNILYIEVSDAAKAVDILKENNILVIATAINQIRVVFHRDIDDDGLNHAITVFRKALI